MNPTIDDPESPKDVLSYWTYPISLVWCWESGLISEAEFMLLGKIKSYDGERGCYASNGYLARWWHRSKTWVSLSLKKFAGLGLIRMETTDGMRRIYCQFDGRRLPSALKLQLKGPLSGVKGGALSGVKASIDKRVKRGSNATRAGARRGVGGDSPFIGNGEHHQNNGDGFNLVKNEIDPQVHQFCLAHAALITKKGWCAGDRHEGFTKRGALQPGMFEKWEKIAQEFSQTHPIEEMRKVWNWWAAHCEDEVAFQCLNMNTFCRKFSKMRLCMRKGEHLDADDVCVGIIAEEVF